MFPDPLKKKKNSGGKKTLPLDRRLPKAKLWATAYSGKKIVRAYSKRFGVDLPTAINDLRLVGIVISEQYEQAVKQSIAALAARKQSKKDTAGRQPLADYSNDEFAFIAGFTSWGFPYGIRWDELPPDGDE